MSQSDLHRFELSVQPPGGIVSQDFPCRCGRESDRREGKSGNCMSPGLEFRHDQSDTRFQNMGVFIIM